MSISSSASDGASPRSDTSISSTKEANLDIHGNLKCMWGTCKLTFEDANMLYDHLCNDHVGRKATNNLCLVCGWVNCGVSTVKRDHITSHLRVHVPLKPHECRYCQKSFKRLHDLKKHSRVHTENGVYASQLNPSPYDYPGHVPPPESNAANSPHARMYPSYTYGHFIPGPPLASAAAVHGAPWYSGAMPSHIPSVSGVMQPVEDDNPPPHMYPGGYPPAHWSQPHPDINKRHSDVAVNFVESAKRHKSVPQYGPEMASRLSYLENSVYGGNSRGHSDSESRSGHKSSISSVSSSVSNASSTLSDNALPPIRNTTSSSKTDSYSKYTKDGIRDYPDSPLSPAKSSSSQQSPGYSPSAVPAQPLEPSNPPQKRSREELSGTSSFLHTLGRNIALSLPQPVYPSAPYSSAYTRYTQPATVYSPTMMIPPGAHPWSHYADPMAANSMAQAVPPPSVAGANSNGNSGATVTPATGYPLSAPPPNATPYPGAYHYNGNGAVTGGSGARDEVPSYPQLPSRPAESGPPFMGSRMKNSQSSSVPMMQKASCLDTEEQEELTGASELDKNNSIDEVDYDTYCAQALRHLSLIQMLIYSVDQALEQVSKAEQTKPDLDVSTTTAESVSSLENVFGLLHV
ncbi:hypothetical protein CANCADRAFT_58482 [Tortispora caseinolytica NRRL Y-17796]|uniref:C2H2-type domain-containing protein n=1 Tax=Tortispora caseinolytica NRRL Y-17796 TaxID=767744 RepID=A0A1E4TCV2_9ASCO|nr:hypothetical protein CANCADRAFT_58482 [Tortispora caseinolytica NRRL Y-17796]